MLLYMSADGRGDAILREKRTKNRRAVVSI